MIEIVQILRFSVFFLFFVPFFIFGIYGLLLVYYRYNKKEYDEEKFSNNAILKPTVSVITPTHNENSVISKKIENLLASNYPKQKIELIFVDDSTDSTPDIIHDYSERFSNIHLIRFNERMGYSPCMFAGVKIAKGDIVVLSDAGSFHENDTINKLVRNFQNPKIGAVTGNDIILNVDESVGSSENFYQKLYNFMRIAETNMDSTFYFKGEASAVRRSLITDLEQCGATFDTATALLVRKKGFRAVFDPEAKFHEYAPGTRKGRIQQKTIRGANLIKILLRFKSMIFNRNYGKFGLFILPANLGMLVITPIAILLGFSSLIALTFFDPFLSMTLWGLICIISILSLVVSKHLLRTFIDFEISLLRAIYEIIFTKRKHDQIDTIQSTRR